MWITLKSKINMWERWVKENGMCNWSKTIISDTSLQKMLKIDKSEERLRNYHRLEETDT